MLTKNNLLGSPILTPGEQIEFTFDMRNVAFYEEVRICGSTRIYEYGKGGGL